MGIPVPPPPPTPPSTDCPTCTPDPFPAGATPRFVHAVFHDVTPCPGFPDPPNDIPIEISNEDINPCTWRGNFIYSGFVWDIIYSADTGNLQLVCQFGLPWQYFWGDTTPCTPGPFTNTCICLDAGGTGGTGYVLDLPIYYITLLAKTYNLLPDPTGLYDIVNSATPGHKCVRLTGRNNPGSVLIDLDLAGI